MPGPQPVNVARIKQLLSQGLTQKQVTQRLGVSKSVVSMVANGKYLEAVA
jgi:transcriptional regulator with XRE-family HTH domain